MRAGFFVFRLRSDSAPLASGVPEIGTTGQYIRSPASSSVLGFVKLALTRVLILLPARFVRAPVSSSCPFWSPVLLVSA
jgi:hypothetical protein